MPCESEQFCNSHRPPTMSFAMPVTGPEQTELVGIRRHDRLVASSTSTTAQHDLHGCGLRHVQRRLRSGCRQPVPLQRAKVRHDDHDEVRYQYVAAVEPSRPGLRVDTNTLAGAPSTGAAGRKEW